MAAVAWTVQSNCDVQVTEWKFKLSFEDQTTLVGNRSTPTPPNAVIETQKIMIDPNRKPPQGKLLWRRPLGPSAVGAFYQISIYKMRGWRNTKTILPKFRRWGPRLLGNLITCFSRSQKRTNATWNNNVSEGFSLLGLGVTLGGDGCAAWCEQPGRDGCGSDRIGPLRKSRSNMHAQDLLWKKICD